MTDPEIKVVLNDKTGRWFLAAGYATTIQEWDTREEAETAIPDDEDEDELDWEY